MKNIDNIQQKLNQGVLGTARSIPPQTRGVVYFFMPMNTLHPSMKAKHGKK
jgi:hypothetical protein